MKDLLLELLNSVGLGVNSSIGNNKLYADTLNRYTNNKFNFEVVDGISLLAKNGDIISGFIMTYIDLKGKPHRVRVETSGTRITNIEF